MDTLARLKSDVNICPCRRPRQNSSLGTVAINLHLVVMFCRTEINVLTGKLLLISIRLVKQKRIFTHSVFAVMN